MSNSEAMVIDGPWQSGYDYLEKEFTTSWIPVLQKFTKTPNFLIFTVIISSFVALFVQVRNQNKCCGNKSWIRGEWMDKRMNGQMKEWINKQVNKYMSQMTYQGKSQMVYIMYNAGSSWFFWYKLGFKIKSLYFVNWVEEGWKHK
jgi:hypothetical protein